jgi:transglutaminase-like putative cysteine protease
LSRTAEIRRAGEDGVALVVVPISFTSDIRLEHTPSNLDDLQIEPEATAYPFSYSEDELPDLLPFMTRRYPDPHSAVESWVRRFLRQGRSNQTGALLMTLTAAIKESFAYIRRSEPGVHEPGLTLRLGHGSCRDLALLMVEGVRALGFAARFVSGYLYLPTRDDPHIRGGGATMPGVRFICRVLAGLISTPPMALWEIVTLFASLSPVIRAKPCR